ncbi:MAG: alpha/beta fold hydrolase [Burkholderiales bacterium]|nr:alpha/beta fold hydrolase [Burkholderiales bacterium]
MEWLSRGSDVLIDRILEESDRGGDDVAFLHWDIVIIGSGYGAAVAASRLARAGFRDICLLERGREYLPGEFPNDIGNAPSHVRLDRWNGPDRRAQDDALFDFRFGNGVITLTARALGGTSQINANVAMRADPRVFQQDRWPLELRDEFDPLDAHYTAVERWLQVGRVAKDNDPRHPGLPEKYQRLTEMKAPVQRAIERCWPGVEPKPEVTVEPAQIAVTMVEPKGGHNPYGVEQHACVGCGDCVTGCNHRAKNTLTMNYLPDAFRQGVEMFTGVNVDHLAYDEHASDGFRYRVFFDETVETVLGRSQSAKKPSGGAGSGRRAGLFEIRARAVIIAGGVLGSTEVLIRSGEGENGLHVSERLGHFVSLNGDSIGFGYDQNDPVNGVGWGSRKVEAMQAKPGPYVGPTITGVLDARLGRPLRDGVVIEDGIVPGAIETAMHEWLTSAGLMAQLSECSIRGESARSKVDPLAPSARALENTQTYLVVGHDTADGRIRMRDDAGAYIEWPADRAEDPGHQDLLQACEAEEIGGIYLENPVLHPIPKKLSNALAGVALRGATLSVHPLGGVPMGDDFETGVVNHYGGVYDGKYAQSVYPGLFVLDGSIIPTSLGANPLLTIAAIAERAIPFVVRDLTKAKVPRSRPAPDRDTRFLGNIGEQYPRALPPLPQPAPRAYENPNLTGDGSKERDVTLAFKETLRSFADYPAHPKAGAGTSVDPQPSMVASTTFEIADIDGNKLKFHKDEGIGAVLALDLGCADVDKLLANPCHELAVNSGELRLARHLPDSPRSLDADPIPFVALKVVGGAVRLLEAVESGGRWSRIVRAIATWQEMRGKDDTAHQHLGLRLRVALRESINRWSPMPLVDFLRLMWQAFVAILRLAYHAGERRQFRYDLKLLHVPSKEEYRIEGVKDLRFAVDDTVWQAVRRLVRLYLRGKEARRAEAWKTFGNNWWHALLDLHTRLKGPMGEYWAPTLAEGTLRLDLVRLAHESIAQIVSDQRVPDTPRGLLGLTRVGLLFFRVMLKVHFWDFKAPEYVSALTSRNLRPARREGIPVLPESILFSVPIAIGDFKPPLPDGRIEPPNAPGLTLHLTCYRVKRDADAAPQAPNPILLLHGFAQSSTAFINTDVTEDLVVHLYKKGYDVWLLDYRHSIALQSSREVHDLDTAALNDVPYAVDEILAYYRGLSPAHAIDAVTVFGHCMGAVLVSMAALSGRLQCQPKEGEARSRIKAAVLSQVPPFIVGGLMSQFKIDLAAFIRDVLKLRVINLCARGEGSMWLTMADRLFATFPVGDEVCPHEFNRFEDHMQDGIGTCKRITGIIGRLYRHVNLKQATHDRLPDYFGWANIAVFAQIAKFFQCERIVNADGSNVYATRENIQKYMNFPVLFLHGKQNVVFDEESARRSCVEFKRANRDVPYGLELIEGYAHYDCIVGKAAEADVFCKVTRFLADPKDADPMLVSGGNERAAVSKTQVMVPQLGPWITGLTANDREVDISLKLSPNRDWSVQPAVSYVFEDNLRPPRRFRDADWNIGNPPELSGEPDPERRDFMQKIRGTDERVENPAPAERWTADVITLSGGGPPADIAVSGSKLYAHLKERAEQLARLAREPELRTIGRILLAPLTLEDAAIRVSQALIAAARKSDEIAFFASCCRHPGTGFETILSDLAFGGMATRLAEHANSVAIIREPLPQLCLLLGDQIYADAMGGVFDTERPIEKFVQRYYRAYASPNFRALVRHMPLHLTIDDHEIQDNYSCDMKAGDLNLKRLAATGLEAARAFQGISLDPATRRLWYKMNRSGFDFFLLDTRSGRFRNATRGESKLMDDDQWRALEDWLKEIDKTRPKFIASGSVVLPRSQDVRWASDRDAWTGNPWLQRHRPETRWDSWSAFPEERERLFRLIVKNGVDNVVFVSGDYHTSSFSKLEIRDGTSVWKAYSVVSPPAYAPFPFANDRADRLETDDILQLWPKASVKVATLWRYDGSGFSEVYVRRQGRDWSVYARWFDQRGWPHYPRS